MKKVVAMLSALTLTLAMGVTAFAADENIALGKTPMVNITNVKTADGNGSYETTNALDGNTDTRWSLSQNDTKVSQEDGSYGVEIWFGVDLRARAEFNSVTIVWDTAGADHSEEGYTLQYCEEDPDTEGNWKDIDITDATYDEETKNSTSTGYIDTLHFDTVEARYVRIVLHKAAYKNNEYKAEPSIWEFEVYGTMLEEPEEPVSSAAPEVSSAADTSSENASSAAGTSSWEPSTVSRNTTPAGTSSASQADTDNSGVIIGIVLGVVAAVVVVAVIVVIVIKNKKKAA